jgi:hypothetical protein
VKKPRKAAEFLKHLRTIPNVSLACEKAGLSRNTIYRWCKEDSEFKELLNDALKTGVESVSDLAESKLITHINNGSMRAIEYWLDNHKTNYARPRPKSFWEEITRQGNPVTKIIIETPETREQVEKRMAEERTEDTNN